MPDVFKILKDLELKAVGLDPQSQKMQEGYFVAFRSVGLPIHKDDYARPWSPLGAPPAPLAPAPEPVDPQTTAAAPPTTSASLEQKQAQIDAVSSAMKSYVNTFLLIDDKLQMNNMYSVMPGSSKISDSWFAIVNGAHGIPTTSEVSPQIKAQIDSARAKLQSADGNITPRYDAYMRFQDEYNSKVRAMNKAYAGAFTDPNKLNMWPIEGAVYQDEKNEAFARWTGLGFKAEIEQAIATLAAQGIDPAMLLIKRAKEKYQNSLFNFPGLGNLPYTILSPASWYDKDNDDGWTGYSSREFHTQSNYSASSTAYGGGGGFNLGFWRAGGSFNRTENRENANFQTNGLSVEFQYCAVDIRRPWLDTSLLNLPNWFLVGDYKKHCISNGKMAQEVPQGGVEPAFLPSVVTSLVLIKDLKIAWTDWKSQWSSFNSSTSGSANVGFGPFSVRGHYSKGNTQRSFSSDDSGEALTIPGIQLVGYVSQILPPSPQKDSAPFMVAAPQ
jgi:hypothetical protein